MKKSRKGFGTGLEHTYAPFMATFFDTRPVSLGMWGVILGIGVTVLLILEFEKWLMGKWRARTEAVAKG